MAKDKRAENNKDNTGTRPITQKRKENHMNSNIKRQKIERKATPKENKRKEGRTMNKTQAKGRT